MKTQFFSIVMSSTGKGMKEAGKAIMKNGPELIKSASVIGLMSIGTSLIGAVTSSESKKIKVIAEDEGRRRAMEYLKNKENKED